MSFVAKKFNLHEIVALLSSQSIPQSRFPTSSNWPCAIDRQRDAQCVQLLGTSHEMLDDRYYYLLIWRGISSVFRRECGRLSCTHEIVNSKRPHSDEEEALRMAEAAIAAIDKLNKSPESLPYFKG